MKFCLFFLLLPPPCFPFLFLYESLYKCLHSIIYKYLHWRKLHFPYNSSISNPFYLLSNTSTLVCLLYSMVLIHNYLNAFSADSEIALMAFLFSLLSYLIFLTLFLLLFVRVYLRIYLLS